MQNFSPGPVPYERKARVPNPYGSNANNQYSLFFLKEESSAEEQRVYNSGYDSGIYRTKTMCPVMKEVLVIILQIKQRERERAQKDKLPTGLD